MSYLDKLLGLIEKYSREIQAAFINGVQDVVDNALLSQVVQMVERNDVEGALRALGQTTPPFNPMFMVVANAFQAGGALMMTTMPKYVTDATGTKTMLRFNIRDPRAEKWLSEFAAEKIVGIEDDIRQVVRDTMQSGMVDGRNPRSVALDIVGRYNPQTGHREGGVVGLGPQQEAWARSARAKLGALDRSYLSLGLRDKRFDSVVERAIASGEPLTNETIEKLVVRYRANALKYRGETIARTDALAALNKAEYESVIQAQAQSDLPLAATTKVWKTRKDGRQRHSHDAMHEQRRALDEPFESPTGARMMHPGDTSLNAQGEDVIDCRCRVFYDTDFLYGIK